MMASFRLKNVAHEAVTTAFLFGVTQVKAPKHWNLTWVSCHSLYKRPNQKYEDNVEYQQHEKHWQ
jgi:hypothetical protein